MAAEAVEKRERRLVRERHKLAAFRHALRFFTPLEALKETMGMYATWDAVRRVATEIIRCEVEAVPVAWKILYFVKGLPDGSKRLKAATEAAVAQWEAETEPPQRSAKSR